MKPLFLAVVAVLLTSTTQSRSDDEPSYEELKEIATGPEHEGAIHERLRDLPHAPEWELTGYSIVEGKRFELPKLILKGFYTKDGTHLVHSTNRPGEADTFYSITTFAPEDGRYLHWVLQPPNIVVKATGVLDKEKKEMVWTTDLGRFTSLAKETWDGEKVTTTEVTKKDGVVMMEQYMVTTPIKKIPEIDFMRLVPVVCRWFVTGCPDSECSSSHLS